MALLLNRCDRGLVMGNRTLTKGGVDVTKTADVEI